MPASPTSLVARDVTKTVDDVRLLRRVSIAVTPDRVVALPPGDQASALLSLLAGREAPDAGHVDGPEHRVHITDAAQLASADLSTADALLLDLGDAPHDADTRHLVQEAVTAVDGPVVLVSDDTVLITALGARLAGDRRAGRTGRGGASTPTRAGAGVHNGPQGISRADLARRAAPRR